MVGCSGSWRGAWQSVHRVDRFTGDKSASVNGYSHARLPSLALQWALCASLLFATASHGRDEQCDGWPAWQRFKRLYLSEDGRVIDASTPRRITVSEGQAYALIFALIANDPAAFSRIIRWTQENLGKYERVRSEEHTSELQSPDHLVCRLLLEKNKDKAPAIATCNY